MPSTFQNYRFRKYYQNLTPLFKSSRFQGYAMIIMSLFTIAFFGLFAIKPTLKTIAALNRQIADKNTLNNQLDEKINSLILAQEEYQNIQNDLSLIYSLMPVDPQFPLLFRKLEILASENDIAISNIQFDPLILYQTEKSLSPVASNQESIITAPDKVPEPTSDKTNLVVAKKISALSYTLEFTGGYQNLILLLDRLTKLDRLVTIVSVQLSSDIKDTEKSKLNINLEANSYYLPLSL